MPPLVPPLATLEKNVGIVAVPDPRLDRLIRGRFNLLGLQTYFAAGEEQVRISTIHREDTVPIAAGVIHSDFERGFVRVEAAAYGDFVTAGGGKEARKKGLARAEGRD